MPPENWEPSMEYVTINDMEGENTLHVDKEKVSEALLNAGLSEKTEKAVIKLLAQTEEFNTLWELWVLLKWWWLGNDDLTETKLGAKKTTETEYDKALLGIARKLDAQIKLSINNINKDWIVIRNQLAEILDSGDFLDSLTPANFGWEWTIWGPDATALQEQERLATRAKGIARSNALFDLLTSKG